MDKYGIPPVLIAVSFFTLFLSTSFPFFPLSPSIFFCFVSFFLIVYYIGEGHEEVAEYLLGIGAQMPEKLKHMLGK